MLRDLQVFESPIEVKLFVEMNFLLFIVKGDVGVCEDKFVRQLT